MITTAAKVMGRVIRYVFYLVILLYILDFRF